MKQRARQTNTTLNKNLNWGNKKVNMKNHKPGENL